MAINIGLVGFGTVGRGVVEILTKNAAHLEKRLGTSIRIKAICVRNTTKARDISAPNVTLTNDVNALLNDPDIQIIVEMIGGEFPAYDIIKKALQNNKHVVTANKEVVAKHKTELFKLAKDHGTDIFYEASVGGGIPIIRSLKVGFAANKILAIYGILNGTTNYILTKISEEKREFEDVLKEAQKLGFAESDPSMDVSGLDAAYKLLILAATAFKADVNLADIYYEGIDKITLKDIQYAKEFGYEIKLLATGKVVEDEKLSLKVHPTMVPLHHPLAAVRNEMNAIYLQGDAVGEAMLYGKGAGGLPTASSIVSDIIDIAFDVTQKSTRNLEQPPKLDHLVPIGDTHSKFYLRIRLREEVGVLAQIPEVFANHKVSILTMHQYEVSESEAEVVIITHPVQESRMQQSIAELKNLSAVLGIESVIRVGLE